MICRVLLINICICTITTYLPQVLRRYIPITLLNYIVLLLHYIVLFLLIPHRYCAVSPQQHYSILLYHCSIILYHSLLPSPHRYCAVTSPLHYSMTVTGGRSARLITAVWVIAGLYSGAPLLMHIHRPNTVLLPKCVFGKSCCSLSVSLMSQAALQVCLWRLRLVPNCVFGKSFLTSWFQLWNLNYHSLDWEGLIINFMDEGWIIKLMVRQAY